MISFVTYFSSAEGDDGYIVIDGQKTAASAFTGGPTLESGTYKLDANGIEKADEIDDDSNLENECIVVLD